jgi:hypothetical protein
MANAGFEVHNSSKSMPVPSFTLLMPYRLSCISPTLAKWDIASTKPNRQALCQLRDVALDCYYSPEPTFDAILRVQFWTICGARGL